MRTEELAEENNSRVENEVFAAVLLLSAESGERDPYTKKLFSYKTQIQAEAGRTGTFNLKTSVKMVEVAY